MPMRWIRRAIVLAVITLLGTLPRTATAEERKCPPNPYPKPGEKWYQHCENHDIYRDLRKKYDIRNKDAHGNSCCDGQDCRVTLPFKEPTSEQENYQVWVDGTWCPVGKDALVTLSPAQKKREPSDPHLQEFVRQYHVCATRFDKPPVSDSPHTTAPAKPSDLCKQILINCIFEGGAKS